MTHSCVSVSSASILHPFSHPLGVQKSFALSFSNSCVCMCVCAFAQSNVRRQAHPSSFLSVLLSIECTHPSPRRTVHRTHTGLSETWNLVYTVYPFSVLIQRARVGVATYKLDCLEVTVQYIKHILKSSWLPLFHSAPPACTLLINTLNEYV